MSNLGVHGRLLFIFRPALFCLNSIASVDALMANPKSAIFDSKLKWNSPSKYHYTQNEISAQNQKGEQ